MPTKRRGLVPLIIGLLLMFIAAPALFVGGAWYGVRGMIDVAEEAPVVQPGGTVEVTQNEPFLILVDVGAGSGTSLDSSTGTPLQECAVVDSNQLPVVRDSGSQISATFGGRQYQSAGLYVASASGAHTITCDGPAKVLSGSDATDLGSRTVLTVVGGLVLGFLAGLIGFILAIVGIVKLVRSGRERRSMGGQPPYGGQSGYGSPAPYGGGAGYGGGAPPPPGAQGTGAAYGQGGYPPPPGPGSSEPSAYGDPGYGQTATGQAPYAQSGYGDGGGPAPGDPLYPDHPDATRAGGSSGAAGSGTDSDEDQTPPPPPPPSGPTYRDPTAY